MSSSRQRSSNRTIAKLRAGRTVVGASCTSDSPDVIEVLAALGFDYVTIDLEHLPYNEVSVAHCIRAANASGITPIVRAARDPDLLLRLLTAGAEGVHIPHVSTAADAKDAVAAVRLHPKGGRTFYSTGRSGGYGIGIEEADYIRTGNEETLIVLQVENQLGIANLDEIMSVPHFDAIQFGPKDLRQSMGYPSADTVWPVVERAIARASDAGIWVSMVAWMGSDPLAARADTYRKLGVRMITGQATDFFVSGARSFLARHLEDGRASVQDTT